MSFGKYISIILLLFVLYLPWPVRNYFKSDKIILIKPLSAGYADYQKDMLSYMYWLYAWHSDQPDEYLAYSYKTDREIIFPDEIFSSESEKQLAINAVQLAQRCGTSFIEWQREAGKKTGCYGCYDNLIARGFRMLKHNYRVNHPFNYYIKVPLINLRKAFFKTSLTNSVIGPQDVFKIVMVFRCIFLFLGVFAVFLYWKMDYFKISFLFFLVIYIFVVAELRQVEMRYLFQADVLMLMAATAFISNKIFRTDKESQKTN